MGRRYHWVERHGPVACGAFGYSSRTLNRSKDVRP